MTYREFIEQLAYIRTEHGEASGGSSGGAKSWQEQMNVMRFFSELQKAKLSRGRD